MAYYLMIISGDTDLPDSAKNLGWDEYQINYKRYGSNDNKETVIAMGYEADTDQEMQAEYQRIKDKVEGDQQGFYARRNAAYHVYDLTKKKLFIKDSPKNNYPDWWTFPYKTRVLGNPLNIPQLAEWGMI